MSSRPCEGALRINRSSLKDPCNRRFKTGIAQRRQPDHAQRTGPSTVKRCSVSGSCTMPAILPAHHARSYFFNFLRKVARLIPNICAAWVILPPA